MRHLLMATAVLASGCCTTDPSTPIYTETTLARLELPERPTRVVRLSGGGSDSTYYVLTELVRAVGPNPDTRSAEGIGRLVAQLHTMRRMSVSVAGMLQAGKEPVVEASIVKDIGTVWEQQLPHRVRDLAAFVEETATNRETLERQLDFAIKTAPKLTIQGGTTEVLRGIIARGLGLR